MAQTVAAALRWRKLLCYAGLLLACRQPAWMRRLLGETC